MELKVWVDGIQKVVCGVTYSTTCQDVVLALACALGQTGRFSLVEKWRDSDRALVPAECPLQCLHKLGEYAGEVRYYLIRAGSDTAGQRQPLGQKADISASNLQQFGHKFSSPDQSPQCLNSAELIKRSSTFSGAHQSQYGRILSPLQPSSTSLSQQRCAQALITPALSSAATTGSCSRSCVTSNGKPGSLSLNGTNSSSLPSCGRSGQNASENCLSKETSSQPQISSRFTFSEEAGKHCSLNTSSYSSHSLPRKYNSQQLQRKADQPSQQLQRKSADQNSQQLQRKSADQHSQQFHSDPGKTQQPVIVFSQQHSSSSSEGDYSRAMIKPQQRQQHLSLEITSNVTKQSDQKPHPVPSLRHRLASSSPVSVPDSVLPHVRLKDTQKPRQKEELHGAHLQSMSACVALTDVNSARSISSDGVGGGNLIASGPKIHTNKPFQHSQGGTTSNNKPSSILRIAREYLQKNGNHQLEQPFENSQGRVKLKGDCESPSDTTADVIKYATLDRHFTRSRPNPALPSRSLSIGHGDDDQMMNNKLLVRPQRRSVGDCLQHCAEEKTSQVSKTENSTDSSSNKKLSSFASAVAHIRQSNVNVGNNKANIAHIRQHSEGSVMKPINTGSHVRQHSSDSSYTDSHLKGLLPPSNDHVQSVSAPQHINSPDSGSKYKNTSPQQSNIKTSSSFSHPPLLHKSTPPELCRQSSHQESGMPHPHSSALSNKFNKNIQVDRIKSIPTIGSSPNSQGTNSEEVNLKCSESSCDQNCPDMSTKNIANHTGPNKDEKSDVSVAAAITSRQAKREYRQLLRTVEMQKERIRLQEVQINATDFEITSFEEKEIRNKEKLQAVLEEISSFEVQETVIKEELGDLEKTEWISVLEKEQELDAKINAQITSLKVKLEQLESEIKQLKDEEDKKSQEIKSEEEREEQERKENEELEKQVTSEKEQLDQQLNNLSAIINEQNMQLETLEKEILDADKAFNEKEEQVKSIEEELKTEDDRINSQSEVLSVFPAKTNSGTFPNSDSGEAILKILEYQLSAQSPPSSPFIHEDDNLGGITSAQHLYTLGSVQTHNGIWV